MAVKKTIQNIARAFAGQPEQYAIPSRLLYHQPVSNVDTLSTGLRAVDKMLGVGGLPRGKIIELIGSSQMPISDGFHCLAAKIGANVQRKQQLVTIIDMIHNFDPWQSERCGLMTPHLLLSRPDTVFSALTTLESAARSEGLIIINMGTVLEPLNHAEPDLLKNLLSRVRTIIRQSDSAFLFVTAINNDNPFDPLNYPPGFPLGSLADIRLWIQDEQWINKNGHTTAYKVSLTVIKNNLALVGTGAEIRIKLAGF